MVKRTITITTILLILSIAISLIIVLNKSSFAADGDIASGTSGTCSWVIDSEGVLTISPTDGVSGTLDSYLRGNGPFYDYRSQISKVYIAPGVSAANGCYNLFNSFMSCTEIDVINLDTSNATNMGNMFSNCRSVINLDLKQFDTSKVTNMSGMFEQCKELTNIDLSSFNTHNVTDMSYMFYGSNKILSLDLSGFDLSSVTTMKEMFRACSSLTSITFNKDTSTPYLRNMNYMFTYCSSIKSIDLSSFDVSNVWDMTCLFDSCNNIENIDISGWHFDNMTSLKKMFNCLTKLENINFKDCDTSHIRDMSYMFCQCYSLKDLDLSSFDTSNVTNMGYMFRLCTGMDVLDLSMFDTSKVTDMSLMFEQCNNLERVIGIEDFDTSSVTNMYYMFYKTPDNNSTALKSLNLSRWDVSNVRNMCGMFHSNKSLIELNLSGWKTTNVSDMTYMFYACHNLKRLDLSSFFVGNTTMHFQMFDNCYKLREVKLGKDFKFKNQNNSTTLPTPPSTSPYTGNWIRADKVYGPYNPNELTEQYNPQTMNGTWIWQGLEFYDVSYSYRGFIPEGASALPINSRYVSGDIVTVAEQSTALGYTFSGWSRTGTFEMPAENVAITGSFIPNTDTPYKVEHYLEDITENNYTLTKTDNLTGTTDTEVSATAKEYEGYTFDNTIEGTKQSGTIAGDGSLVLKLYYKRNSYNVTYAYTGDVPDGASELPQSETYKYGAEINVPEEATLEGYTFSGWIKNYITMPAQDIEITGYFIENPKSYNYKVEYYFDGKLDDSLEEILDAEKDESISITPQNPLKYGERNYTLVSNNHNIVVSVNDENNVIRVFYETDVLDYAIDNFEDTTEGDGIPDKYQISITYKVENGNWNDGTKGTKTDIITLKDKDGNLSEEGTGTTTIPEVGNKPSEGYEVGSWNEEIPTQVSREDDGKGFIYSYKKSEKQNIEQKEEKDISEASGKIYNPKTDDIVNKYLLVGIGGILVLAIVNKIRRKYSRKARKVQY